jgi:uncharacterized membrane protein (UPF0182 family)
MRDPDDIPSLPRRRFSRRRIILIAAVAAVFLLLTTMRGVAGFYTDSLWFDQLGFRSVWTGLLAARIGLALVFIALFFLLLWPNLLIADRASPRFEALAAHEEALARMHQAVDRRRGLVRIALALLVALPFGAGVAGRWNDWILFRNHVPFGIDDPQFGRDVGFYVFQLPFLSFLTDWLFSTLIVVTLITAAAHYFNGGIRLRLPPGRPISAGGGLPPRPPMPRLGVSSGVKVHLSVLFGAMALVRAASYYLDRFELVFSRRGVVDGASYTDVNAQLPAIHLLIAISVFAAGLFIANIWRRGWVLPGLAVGLWAAVAIIVASAYPAFIQRFRVEPAESTREAPFIERNIEATRAAMGIGDVAVRDFAYDEELASEALVDNAETIRNVRLWDPRVLRQTYQRLQEVRTFYRFTDVDVDRYKIDDAQLQILLSAREINPDSLPSDTWENRHLAFTHGYGAVLSPANAVTSDGQPDLLVKNIPPQGEPKIAEPRLYHGESIGGYAIVNAGRDEIDFVQEDGTAVTNRYEGRGGVGVGSLPRRLAFALRFGDINPLISGFMTSNSRILYIRDVRERAHELAPFLHYDHDPYPVVLDGRILWVLDAYTTTDRYPYAQRAETDRLPDGSDLHHRFNYVRNSVKVTVDAYDGDVTFYAIDPDDPIAAAYGKAFPKLFTPASEIPDDLRAHFRFPEDLFRVQTNMWGRYHIGDSTEFYSQSDRWNIAQDPGSVEGATLVTETDPETGETTATRQARMDPYYLLMRLPGARSTEFLILQPFVPFSENDSRRELSAFMVAKSDPREYGKLEVFVMPRDRQVDGPSIVNARINQEPEVSQLITLLSRAGSEVILGNLVIVPVEQSLIYVRPLYVQASGAQAVPELKKVIVVFGDQVAIRDTLQDALVAVFGDAPETLEEGPGEEPTEPTEPTEPGEPVPDEPVPGEVRRLLDRAAREFERAEAALREGDLARYEEHIRNVQAAIEEARGGPPPETTPDTTTTTATTTTSAPP